MSDLQTIKVPDMGDFDDVEVIEVLIAVGDTIDVETSLITVESDKASMEIPSPAAGVVTSVVVSVGDRVSPGTDLMVIDAAAAPTADQASPAAADGQASGQASDQPAAASASSAVAASAPAQATAQALLHTSAVIQETRDMSAHGVTFGEPVIDIDKLRSFKEGVIGKLTGGLAGLAKQRKVTVAHGLAQFASANAITIEASPKGGDPSTATRTISFDSAIIAAGSESIQIPGFPYDDPRLVDSTGALELREGARRLPATPLTAYYSLLAARPMARRSTQRLPAWQSTSVALSPQTHSNAPTWRTSTPSVTSSVNRCLPTRPRYRSGSRLDGPDRNRREGARHRL